MSATKLQQEGYVAILTTILVSLFLALMVSQEGFAGWHARFNVLSTQEKEQATSLAEGCLDQAVSRLISEITYVGNTTTTSAVGSCHVLPIAFNTPSEGYATLKAQGIVNESYTNLSLVIHLNDIHVGAVTSPTRGTVIVQVLMANSDDAKEPENFSIKVEGSAPFPATFKGSEIGTVVSIGAGSYSVNESDINGYLANYSSGCNGTIAGGEVKICTIINSTVTTTITLGSDVINDHFGTKTPADFVYLIDGKTVTIGTPQEIDPGTHAIAVSTSSLKDSRYGYSTALNSGTQNWTCSPKPDTPNDGTNSMVDIDNGDNLICILTIDDNPPPAPTCADNVLLLNTSLGTPGINAQGAAMKALLDLYKELPSSTQPKVSVGSYPGNLSGQGVIPTRGGLTSSYGTTSRTADGPRLPTATGTQSQWNYPENAFAITGAVTTVLNGSVQEYKRFGFDLPTDALIEGIEVIADGKATGDGPAATSSAATGAGNGNASKWTAVPSASSKYAAVATHDGDASYVTDSKINEIQMFTFPNVDIPSTATNVGVTVHAVAKAADSGASLKFRTGSGSSVLTSGALTLTPDYASYSWTPATNPATGKNWTAADINSLSNHPGFGVVNSTDTKESRVTQLFLTINYAIPPATVNIQFSYDGGKTKWTSAKTVTLSAVESAAIPEGNNANDTWGRSWLYSDVNDTNFALRLTNTSANGMLVSLNYVTVKVHYSLNSTPSTGLYDLIEDLMGLPNGNGLISIPEAINAASTELFSSRQTEKAHPRVLILTSDGQSKESDAQVLTTAEDSDITIFTLFYTNGVSGNPALLSAIASSTGGLSYTAAAPSDMTDIFTEIGEKVCPALAPPAAGTATSSAVTVITRIINNDNGTTTQPSAFSQKIQFSNGSVSFAGADVPGVTKIITPGSYSVTESPLAGYAELLSEGCTADVSNPIVAGENRLCIITNDDTPPPPEPPNLTVTPGTWEEIPTQ